MNDRKVRRRRRSSNGFLDILNGLLTLLVIPTVYEIMDGFRARALRVLGRAAGRRQVKKHAPEAGR